MKKISLLLILLLPLQLLAAEDITFKMVDEELGVYNDDYNIQSDRQRFSLMFSHGSNIKGLGEMYSAEFQYGLKIEEVWVETFIAQTSASYKSLFGAQDNTIDSTDLGDTTEKMITAGFGLGYRFNYIQELFGSNKWYETTTAYATYNLMEEAYSTESFQGFGLRTDFGIHYRMSAGTQIGFKGIYHVASLVRGASNDTEKRADRSLTTATLSFGFEYGFFY